MTTLFQAADEEDEEEEKRVYEATCTVTCRDACLFAVSVGYGSTWGTWYDRELRHVWEQHPQFTVVPSLAVCLSFWAIPNDCPTKTTTLSNPISSLPDFPPPMMKQMGLIPRHCLSNQKNNDLVLDDYPVLHMWQSIAWHAPSSSLTNQLVSKSSGTDMSSWCRLEGRFCAVQPKSVGTFVTTETQIVTPSRTPLYTLQSTALILGLDPNVVVPMKPNSTTNNNNTTSGGSLWQRYFGTPKGPPCYQQEFSVATNQALLYRLASGDSNGIHVDASLLPAFVGGHDDDDDSKKEANTNRKPILHGLATLAMTLRILEQGLDNVLGENFEFCYMEASFRKPVFVGDALQARLWWTPESLHHPATTTSTMTLQQPHDPNIKRPIRAVIGFDVVHVASNEICLSRGVAVLEPSVGDVPLHNKARL